MKNRAPAPIQITAEQLIREAKERQLEGQSMAREIRVVEERRSGVLTAVGWIVVLVCLWMRGFWKL